MRALPILTALIALALAAPAAALEKKPPKTEERTVAWPDGTPREICNWIGDVRQGECRTFREDGSAESSGSYQDGKTWEHSEKHGPWTFWTEDGRKLAEGRYDGGAQVGAWTYWTATGEAVTKDFGDGGY